MNRNTDFIPFARPSIGCEEEQALLSVLRSGWLTTGKETEAFENEFAAFVKSKHALAVSSATAGLHLALDALGVGPEACVVTTPYTFAATAEVARYLGADPLFVDIEETSGNIDSDALSRCLERHQSIRAIIPVHFAGLPCDMDAISELSDRFRVPVVEDAAHCFPVRIGDEFVGTIGQAGVYSFYVTKPITTGEGGMLVTESDTMARRVRLMRLHGIDRDVWDRYTSGSGSWDYRITEAGYKYNLTDMASAIGRIQLQRAEKLLVERRRIAAQYLAALAESDFLTLPLEAENHAWHLFVVRLATEKLTISRDEFIARLRERGIGVSVHFRPLHMMPYYERTYHYCPQDFPVSLANYLCSVSLPIYPGLSDEQIERVVRALKEIGTAAYKKTPG